MLRSDAVAEMVPDHQDRHGRNDGEGDTVDTRGDGQASPEALEFDTDAGSSRSKWAAGLLVVAMILWMGSGFVWPTPEDAPEAAKPADPIAVAVMASQARSVAQVFVAEGQATPDRETSIRAEISGEIEEVFVSKGADLEAGDLIAKFKVNQRVDSLERAEEDLRVARRELENAQALLNRGAATADRVSQARASLAAAEADYATAKQSIDDTQLVAPFAGRLDEMNIDVGEFVNAGTDVARIIDVSPLEVVVQVPQQILSTISVGQPAQVRFITGLEVAGKVVFVGASADNETRTFRVEIEVPNDNSAIPSGLSARVTIPTGEAVAHFVSPAILSLDTDGTLGVKIVDGENKVAFHEVEIVRAQNDGIWISGLPDAAQIITVGQGFVSDGEEVEPMAQDLLDQAGADQ